MILNTGKENVSKKNSSVLTTTGSSVSIKNSTVLVPLNSWCHYKAIYKESLM